MYNLSIKQKKEGLRMMKGMGIMLCAKGNAAKTIQRDMNNPSVSKRVLAESAQAAKSITPMKLTQFKNK